MLLSFFKESGMYEPSVVKVHPDYKTLVAGNGGLAMMARWAKLFEAGIWRLLRKKPRQGP